MKINSNPIYCDFYYQKILDDFKHFKHQILDFLKNLENKLYSFIETDYNYKKFTYAGLIDLNYCNMNKMVEIIKKYTKLENNELVQKNFMDTNTIKQLDLHIQNIYKETKQLFTNFQFLNPYEITFHEQKRMKKIQQINYKTIKRTDPYDGFWQIQSIRLKSSDGNQEKEVCIVLQGKEIILGISAEIELERQKYQVFEQACGIYYMEMNGTLYGLKLQNDSLQFKPGDIASLSCKFDQNFVFIIKNKTTQKEVSFLIQPINDYFQIKLENWVYFIGLGEKNDQVTLIE